MVNLFHRNYERLTSALFWNKFTSLVLYILWYRICGADSGED
jgi:hypothetical protein